MKIFIDTADIDEIKEAFSWGIVDGITTNPSLIKKAVEKHKLKSIENYLVELFKLSEGTPVSLEVIGITDDEMISQAETLHKKFSSKGDVVIKVPINPALKDADITHYHGLKVIKALHKKNIKTNATLIMTPEQAMLAAKAGAEYVSPFAGRIDDLLKANAGLPKDKLGYFNAMGIASKETRQPMHDNGIVSGVDLIRHCVEIISKHKYKTEVIAASIRNARQARECALIGSHISTIPFGVLKDMISHPKTMEGMIAFKNDTIKEYEDLFKK